ncbi:MAG TPA: hypothetical protein VLQ80_16090, partial [Candidatus Saccharimonadia bacterium]|nr:hypothetical protein [Candidatus Saccharimonadia bacterium]
MYRAYLQGCALYLNEVDVIRHVVVTTFGNMQGFLTALDKSKNPTDVFTGMLVNLQWGERLWRNMLYISSIDAINAQTAPVTRQVRKEFLKLYPVHRQSGKVHTLINETFFKNSQTKVAESALLQRPDFWKELLRQFNAAVRAEGDEQDDATPAHDIPQVLQVLATGVVDSDEDDLGGQLILRSHILPVHRSVCPTMRFEYKSPMAIYTRMTELNPALRAIAHRRFVQPLCLLAATMFPAMDTMRYTSSADGKAYKWNQLVMQSDTDPLILSIGRQFRVVIQSALARAKAADVDWKEEIEAIQQKSGQLPDGVLLAMSSFFAEPAIEKARKKAAAAEEKKQTKKKKKESPPPPPPDGPGKKEFTAAAEAEARRKQVDNVALQILSQSLEMPRGGGQARFVSHSAIVSLIALYGHTTYAGVTAAAERKTFDMLALRLNDAQLQTTAKKLSEADEPLMTKLYMHLTAKDAKKPEVKKSKPIARPAPAPPRAQHTQQPPKGPDLTARKATQPQVEDFASQDADEAEENRYLLEGLSK